MGQRRIASQNDHMAINCMWLAELKIWRAINVASDELIAEATNLAELEQLVLHYISAEGDEHQIAYDYRTDVKRHWLH